MFLVCDMVKVCMLACAALPANILIEKILEYVSGV
jgi:hypothetical protein